MGHFNDLNLPYEFIGAGNDGGEKNSESVGIFYRADKFTLLDSGTKWLSKTPDVLSKFENAQWNRAVTYAVLQNKETGKTFVHMNTHLDTNTHLQGKTRDQQAEVLAGIIQEFKDYPVIVTGDFNSRPNTEPHKLMHEIGLVSSGDVAARKHGHETFHDYGEAAPDCIIDYLFITPKNMAAVNYRVCNEKIDGNYPSDHHPVIADIVFW
jgi:endonuclease/exonuclease/phosphatase family metal-dependent hydrolase